MAGGGIGTGKHTGHGHRAQDKEVADEPGADLEGPLGALLVRGREDPSSELGVGGPRPQVQEALRAIQRGRVFMR